MIEKTKNTVPNIWAAQENLIHFYKLLAAGLGVLAVFMLVMVLVISFRDPIVVTKLGDRQEFYPSTRTKTAIERTDIEGFAKRFLEALYVWSEFNGSSLFVELTPFTEEALTKKVVDSQTSKYGKDFKGKKISQAITFVKVEVLDDRVICKFDRILKIEGVPLVMPTEVTLSMIQGDQTRFNPMGVYVSGIMEHEGAK